ncbi:MAG: serine/threonine-protein kinase [Rubricoccaceae bacterium]|nr:serine/threonine-protein kinase [Rubricoccaceae bacterium]
MPDLPDARWQRLDTLLAEALARSPEGRIAFLQTACDDDRALLRDVLALLQEADEAAEVLGESAASFAPVLAREERLPGLDPGARVGPYRVEGEVGRGGMGVVYRATRADGAFDKTVALKLVKRGMDTDDVLRRFHRERQVLAGLDHPGIARLLDGGAAGDGRPYFVMEYVAGAPITDWADEQGLDLDGRLVLFERACEAVQHAHRRFVVHRDLKPSNILVAEGEGGAPEVKLLYLGIARIIDPYADPAETRTTLRRMTRAYAAPEHIRGEAVTTATDVYALGIVLYELLTGRRPGAEPPPPSAVAQGEGARALRGDLDTICLKALREEPEARYPSVESLLDDLRRRRTGLPIEARPASAGYRVRKFVGRHRAGVAATALVTLALLGGMGAALWQANVAVTERDRAEAAVEEAERTAAFLQSLFRDTDPGETVGDTLSAVDLLDRGRIRLDDEFAATPALHARMVRLVAGAYFDLDDPAEARALLGEALARQRRQFGPNHLETLDTQYLLGSALYKTGDHAAARRLNDDWLARVEAVPDDGSLLYARQLVRLGELLTFRFQRERAEPALRRAYALYGAHGAADEAIAQGAARLLVVLHRRNGAFEEAEAIQRALVHQYEEQENLPAQAGARQALAELVHAQGRYAEANALCRESLAQFERLEAQGGSLGDALFKCGDMLRQQGDQDGARQLLGRAESVMAERFDANPWRALQTSLGHASILLNREAYAEAERLLLARFRAFESTRKTSDPTPQEVLERIAGLYEQWDRPEEAARFRALAGGT